MALEHDEKARTMGVAGWNCPVWGFCTSSPPTYIELSDWDFIACVEVPTESWNSSVNVP